VEVLVYLSVDGIHDFGVAVAYIAHANARDEVHITLTLGSVEVYALCFFYLNG
jgi:hypothetical protein